MFQILLAKIARELEKLFIPYMVIGGQAVLQYAEPRFTRDIDITLGVGLDRLKDILRLAKESGWKVLVESPIEFVAKTMVLPCLEEHSGIRIDLIFSFSPYEAKAMERVHSIEIEGQKVRFASPEDLVVHKMVAGRPQDLADVLSVFRKNPKLDKAYIRGWLVEFSKTIDKPLVQTFEEVLKSK